MRPLNLFYEEPDFDRWFPLDRYPRRILRRILRGKARPGGQMRVFLNLCAGLDRIGVQYRVNDYQFAQKHPTKLVGIVGKPFVLDKVKWNNPILFGAAVFSHPVDDPDLLKRLNIRKVLVPGEWVRQMFEPYYGDAVVDWPVGIDTERWKANPLPAKCFDFLLYDKVRWDHEEYDKSLLEPVRQELRLRGISFAEIRYGFYREEDFIEALRKSRAMIFLCEHETQGIAYQQALAADVPIFAWDRGGSWRDPAYFPQKAQFQPVSSVPYWDDRCGIKFPDLASFHERFDEFWEGVQRGRFNPRNYILENLTLENCARRYVELAQQAAVL